MTFIKVLTSWYLNVVFAFFLYMRRQCCLCWLSAVLSFHTSWTKANMPCSSEITEDEWLWLLVISLMVMSLYERSCCSCTTNSAVARTSRQTPTNTFSSCWLCVVHKPRSGDCRHFPDFLDTLEVYTHFNNKKLVFRTLVRHLWEMSVSIYLQIQSKMMKSFKI